jgi:hypothetical protein
MGYKVENLNIFQAIKIKNTKHFNKNIKFNQFFAIYIKKGSQTSAKHCDIYVHLQQS